MAERGLCRSCRKSDSDAIFCWVILATLILRAAFHVVKVRNKAQAQVKAPPIHSESRMRHLAPSYTVLVGDQKDPVISLPSLR